MAPAPAPVAVPMVVPSGSTRVTVPIKVGSVTRTSESVWPAARWQRVSIGVAGCSDAAVDRGVVDQAARRALAAPAEWDKAPTRFR